MSDLTTTSSIAIGGARSTRVQRRRWRGVHALVSGSVGALVVVSAVLLGVTGPVVSPVSPPAAASGTSGAATDDGAAVDDAGPQDRGARFDRRDQEGRFGDRRGRGR